MSDPSPEPCDSLPDASPGEASVVLSSAAADAWDACFQELWNPTLSRALEAAGPLFDSHESGDRALPRIESYLAAEFWRVLVHGQGTMPSPESERLRLVQGSLIAVLRTVRQSPPTVPFIEDYLEVALRPIRRLRASALTPALCAVLYDYQRGLWTPHLTRPQLLTIRLAVGRTLAALPPEEIPAFWERLQSQDPMMRQAMRIGLEFLRSKHCVPHLLEGLTQSSDHDVRSDIVDCLEEIADPHALNVLIRLRREIAVNDWTLARHIGRVIRVIEQQNRGQNHRTLLRAASTPPDEDRSLLRPASDADSPDRRRARERSQLLRSNDGLRETSQESDPDAS